MIPSEALPTVRAAFEKAQRRYPTIDLPFGAFLSRVDEVVSEGRPAEGIEAGRPWTAAFSQLCHQDLFLATACARGDRIAWEYFADDYLAVLRRWAVHACKSLDCGEDLAQELVATLLGETAAGIMGSSGRGRGRLASYNGRGSLTAWLRVTVSRAAIDRFRQKPVEVSLDAPPSGGTGERAPERAAAIRDPSEVLDLRWAPALSQAVAKAVRELPDRDRLLLSLHYLQAVPLRAIGLQFGAHEATVSRWLERVRNSLRKRIEKELRQSHGLRPREIRCLWDTLIEMHGLELTPVENHGAGIGQQVPGAGRQRSGPEQ